MPDVDKYMQGSRRPNQNGRLYIDYPQKSLVALKDAYSPKGTPFYKTPGKGETNTEVGFPIRDLYKENFQPSRWVNVYQEFGYTKKEWGDQVKLSVNKICDAMHRYVNDNIAEERSFVKAGRTSREQLYGKRYTTDDRWDGGNWKNMVAANHQLPDNGDVLFSILFDVLSNSPAMLRGDQLSPNSPWFQ